MREVLLALFEMLPYFLLVWIIFGQRKRLEAVEKYIEREFPTTAQTIAPDRTGKEVTFVYRGRILPELQEVQ